MAESIITPEFRGAFVQVFRAKAQKNADGSMGAPKFSVRALFAPTADLKQMKAEAQQAVIDKWGADQTKWPKSLRSPFRKNDELDTPVMGIPDDWIVMSFSANEDRRPGVVDAGSATSGPQDIIDESEVYSGAYYRAQIRAYPYDKAGNKGVAFGLQNLQKLRDGEPLGGRIPASKAFDAVASEAGGSTANLFD